jgi:transcriptional regulator with XRE-family HTH domain
MAESFGARLRQRREEREIALTTIAEQTKIKVSLLEALERDDISHWPSGIFRRAFIRAYAHAINLDPDVVVREFFEIYPDPVEVDVAGAVVASAEDPRITGGPPTRLRYLVGSAIGSLSRLRRAPVVSDTLTIRDPVDVPAAADHAFPARSQSSSERSSDEMTEAVPDRPTERPALSERHFLDVANLCTAFGLAETTDDVQSLLQEAARILNAIGVIVWVWDAVAAELRPALASGYSSHVLAQLPTVKRDANNATAAAFRTAQTCAIHGNDHDSGALVVPLLTPAGCAGVLAIELQHGREQTIPVGAIATIVAAQLSQLIGGAQPAEAPSEAEAIGAPAEDFTTPIRHATGRL